MRQSRRIHRHQFLEPIGNNLDVRPRPDRHREVHVVVGDDGGDVVSSAGERLARGAPAPDLHLGRGGLQVAFDEHQIALLVELREFLIGLLAA